MLSMRDQLGFLSPDLTGTTSEQAKRYTLPDASPLYSTRTEIYHGISLRNSFKMRDSRSVRARTLIILEPNHAS